MTTLFFGMSSSDGVGVSEQQWQSFLSEIVTPRFPDGLSQLDGSGQYLMTQGQKIVSERSKLVVLVHPCDEISSRRIGEIRAEYCRRFHQESVLQTDARVEAHF